MITLARKEFAGLLDALLMLDGDPKNPFKYTPKFRYSLAKNIRVLTKKFQDLEKARLGMIRQLAPATFSLPKDSPEAVEFTKKWEPFEQETEEVNLMRFTLADLNLDANPIPIVALAKLGALIIEDEEKPAQAA